MKVEGCRIYRLTYEGMEFGSGVSSFLQAPRAVGSASLLERVIKDTGRAANSLHRAAAHEHGSVNLFPGISPRESKRTIRLACCGFQGFGAGVRKQETRKGLCVLTALHPPTRIYTQNLRILKFGISCFER